MTRPAEFGGELEVLLDCEVEEASGSSSRSLGSRLRFGLHILDL